MMKDNDLVIQCPLCEEVAKVLIHWDGPIRSYHLVCECGNRYEIPLRYEGEIQTAPNHHRPR